jgi:hypothetical protein
MSRAATFVAGVVARDADVIIAGARKSNKFQADGRLPGLGGLANPKPWRFIDRSRGRTASRTFDRGDVPT